MKSIQNVLKKNIRKYRESKGLTQEKFAELINIGTTAVSKIECGVVYPKPETLTKIIKVLDIEPHLLFVDSSVEMNLDTQKDFEKRYNLIKNDPQKFEILYSVLKVLS